MPETQRMKVVSIRMSEEMWESIQEESLRAGISASEFIREAAIVRLGYRWAKRMPEDKVAQHLRRIGIITDRF